MRQCDAIACAPRGLQRLSRQRKPPIALGAEDELAGQLAEEARPEHAVLRSERCNRFCVQRNQRVVHLDAPYPSTCQPTPQGGDSQPMRITMTTSEGGSLRHGLAE